MDDDPVGEGLVVGLDVQRPLLSVQGVLLDEVDVVHTSNLQNKYLMFIFINLSSLDLVNITWVTLLMCTYPFEQPWSVYIQGTAALDPVGGSIFAGLLIHHVTRHKHGDQVTGGKSALVSLKDEHNSQLTKWLSIWDDICLGFKFHSNE